MMGYRVPQPYMMPSARHDSRMTSLPNIPPPPANAYVSAGVMPPNVSSVSGSQTLATGETFSIPRDAMAQSVLPSSTAAPGGPTAGSKSKQGLEKILDTLGKMFPDVRRLVSVVLDLCLIYCTFHC